MKLCQAMDVPQVHDSVIVPEVSCLDGENGEYTQCLLASPLTLTGSLKGMCKLGNALAFHQCSNCHSSNFSSHH